MKKSRTQRRIENLGWTVRVFKSKVVGRWGAVKIEANNISDLRYFVKVIMKMYRLNLKVK